MLKPKLLDLARLNKPATSYKVDEIIRSHGHEVLRLPPYHPEFNAIELIWSQLKQIVRQKNVTFRCVTVGERDKMRGLPSILSLFRNEFNKFNNTRARMLDSIYHMTLRIL